jgi:hypothetical protein
MMSLPEKLAILFSGLFFLSGLLTGVWKYNAMLNRSDHQTPVYVDVAHKVSLLYTFACLLLWKLVESSPFTQTITIIALMSPILFFAIAVLTFIRLGISNKTDNQFTERNFNTTVGMYLLIFFEITGFLVLFAGFIYNQFLLNMKSAG